ncbi:MAG: ABC-F family ATP-binding cassette domain-containing protein [Lachnospiraceae bacterium]|nr:ABC-F family ATP-binding cassette domain-containing protein [Lachnospiraceae bacterium]
MSILNFENVSKTLGNKTILDGVTFGIEAGQKVGVIGVNGAGKSTFLSMATGEMEPDEGAVITSNGLKIARLLQTPDFDNSISLLDNVSKMAYGDHAGTDDNGNVKATLAKFGLTEVEASPEHLSGGQKKRAALAAALLSPSDLLILDEPTNHLDIEMIEWLENFLQHYRGALLMVTHDRYFLDEVTDSILEIDHAKVYTYEENYSGYLELKQQRLDYAKAAERKMATLYKQDLAWMQRGARARSTKQKAHIQRFEELRDRDKLVEDRQVEISSATSRLGNKTVELYNISKAFGERKIYSEFSYNFLRNDRIGIIGPNGCGKSTFIKTILGLVEPDSGHVEVGQTVKFGYFSQENEELDMSMRVIDYIKETAEFIRTPEGLVSASNMCERFLFDGNMQYTLIEKLSGGERRRLYLLKVLMESPNVLILDEPTNDLDIQTLQILEDYLDHYVGVLIVVSHDRYFLDRVVTSVFSFEGDGEIERIPGDYENYLKRKKEKEQDEAETAPAAEEKPKVKYEKTPRKKTKLSFKEQKEYDTIEEEIEKLQAHSEELDAEILKAATDFGKLTELTKEKEETDAKLDERIARYLELEEMVEEFSKQ